MIIKKMPADLDRAAEQFDRAAKEQARLYEFATNAPARKAAAITARDEAKKTHAAALDEVTEMQLELGVDASRDHPKVKNLRRRVAMARADFEGADKTIAECDAIIAGSLLEEIEAANAAVTKTADELHAIASPFIQGLVADLDRRWCGAVASLLALAREGQLLAALWEKSIHAPPAAKVVSALQIPSMASPALNIVARGTVGPGEPVAGFEREDLRFSWRRAMDLQELRDLLAPIAAIFSNAQNVRQGIKRREQSEKDALLWKQRSAYPAPPEPVAPPPPTPLSSYTTTWRDPPPVDHR